MYIFLLVILLKLFLFFSILFLLGWFFAVYILKERRLFILIPLSFSLGISFYLILVNFVSYLIPVNIAFYLILILFFVGIIISLYFYLRAKPSLKIGIAKKYFKYLYLIAFLLFLSGWLMSIPLKEGDNVGFNRAAVPGTILGGNFPLRDIIAPWQPGVYHYAFELLSAAGDRISGLPFWFVADIQIGIFAALIFLLSFVLIHQIIKNEFISFLGSLLFFFSGGLNIFYIFKGPIDLFKYYILGDHSLAAFKFVSLAALPELREPLMQTILLRWPAVAFTVILTIIYFYFKILKTKNSCQRIILSILTGLLLGFLALSAELYFIIIFLTIATSTGLFFIFEWRKDKEIIKKQFLSVLIILFIGLIMFVYQGGVFTAIKTSGNIDKLGISFNILESIKLLRPEFSSFSVFIQTIFITFGFGLFFLIPAIIYFRKNRKILFFIVPLIIISVLPVFLGRFAIQDFRRAFYLTGAFMYLVSGMLILKLMLKASRIKKIILYSFFFIIISGGLLFQVFYTAKAFDLSNRDSFFTSLPAKELIDYDIKRWIDEHTTIDDYFFVEIDDNLFSDLKKRQYYFAQNLSFITYYGRFVPIIPPGGNVAHLNIPSRWLEAIREAKASCSSKSLKELNIKYIYFIPQWPEGLMEKCLENNRLDLVFQSGDNKIYRLK
jgi:hypothetical protein